MGGYNPSRRYLAVNMTRFLLEKRGGVFSASRRAKEMARCRQAACLFTQHSGPTQIKTASAQTDANYVMGHRARAAPETVSGCTVSFNFCVARWSVKYNKTDNAPPSCFIKQEGGGGTIGRMGVQWDIISRRDFLLYGNTLSPQRWKDHD